LGSLLLPVVLAQTQINSGTNAYEGAENALTYGKADSGGQLQIPGHYLHFHTCVYSTVARLFASVCLGHGQSSIIIFASYIKIITGADTDTELTRPMDGHPLCCRAFICQTIEYIPPRLLGQLATNQPTNHFISHPRLQLSYGL